MGRSNNTGRPMPTVRLVPGSPLSPEREDRIVAATTAYIKAAQALDAAGVTALLADDVIYESQWTLEPIAGRSAVGDYIAAKYSTISRSGGARPELCLGRVDLPEGLDYPVALVTQFGKREAFVALTLDDAGKIKRHDFLGLMPHVDLVRTEGRHDGGERRNGVPAEEASHAVPDRVTSDEAQSSRGRATIVDYWCVEVTERGTLLLIAGDAGQLMEAQVSASRSGLPVRNASLWARAGSDGRDYEWAITFREKLSPEFLNQRFDRINRRLEKSVSVTRHGAAYRIDD